MEAQMRPVTSFVLGCAILLLEAASALAAPAITSIDPPAPRLGDLVTITGTDFGPEAGASGVTLIRAAPRSGGNFEADRRRLPLPIVDWRADRILVLMTGVAPGQYSLAIREYPLRSSVKGRESNALTITVSFRPPDVPPPPVAGGQRPATAPSLTLIHPELARPGDTLDLYGDFPFPDPSLDRVFVVPGGGIPAGQVPPLTLRVVEIFKPHARAHLIRDGLPAGEYWLSIGRELPFRSALRRIVVRSTTPAEWEHESWLPGSRSVSWRLRAAIAKVGLEGRDVDVLGHHFGATQERRAVMFDSDQGLEDVRFNLRHAGDPDAPIRPDHLPERVVFWSDSRIRVRLRQDAGDPAGMHATVRVPNPIRYSNAVRITPPIPVR
jgi:hypothetical protein